MSDHLPFELQVDIIKKLPVKSLLLCRSVSKAWKALIDSSDFIAAHSVRHAHAHPHRLLLTCNGNYFSCVDNDTFPQQKFSPVAPLSVRLHKNSKIVGSSHGLLCFCVYDHPFRLLMAVLWNPSIEKSISIAGPYASNDLCRPYVSNETVLGFGVYPVTLDPTIVKITRCDRWNVMVYTLSSGIWKSLSSNLPLNSIRVEWSQVAMDGFIYWSAYEKIVIDGSRSRKKYLIMSFDMSDESFRVIDLPDSLALQPVKTFSICKRRESLVVLAKTKTGVCDVWKMEHGVQISFTKLFAIKPLHWEMMIMGFRKNGGLIVQKKGFPEKPLVAYEPNLDDDNDLCICVTSYWWFSMNTYMETLLLLDRSDCD